MKKVLPYILIIGGLAYLIWNLIKLDASNFNSISGIIIHGLQIAFVLFLVVYSTILVFKKAKK